jgi:hypothetical protein
MRCRIYRMESFQIVFDHRKLVSRSIPNDGRLDERSIRWINAWVKVRTKMILSFLIVHFKFETCGLGSNQSDWGLLPYVITRGASMW